MYGRMLRLNGCIVELLVDRANPLNPVEAIQQYTNSSFYSATPDNKFIQLMVDRF